MKNNLNDETKMLVKQMSASVLDRILEADELTTGDIAYLAIVSDGSVNQAKAGVDSADKLVKKLLSRNRRLTEAQRTQVAVAGLSLDERARLFPPATNQ